MDAIPLQALPVARTIRELVPRPVILPKLSSVFGPHVRARVLRWGERDSKCPMGLLPHALFGVPTECSHFTQPAPFTEEQVHAFADWWDDQTDAAAAVEAVWGDS